MELEKFYYDNRPVKWFAFATILWGIVGMLVGLWVAVAIYYPPLNLGFGPTTFGRMRPVHTNAVIFAFVGNGIFMGVYLLIAETFKDAYV
jgi:cytochrome c oxidase cbb3-type subunit I/II